MWQMWKGMSWKGKHQSQVTVFVHVICVMLSCCMSFLSVCGGGAVYQMHHFTTKGRPPFIWLHTLIKLQAHSVIGTLRDASPL